MAENCTIYCKVLGLDEVGRLLHTHFPAFNPSSGAMGVISVNGNAGCLRLTAKVFRERGDDFCKLLLSTCAFVEGVPNADSSTKSRLASHVESCELALGVVAEPSFDSDERYHAVVFAIANALDGVIFNGQEMLNAKGETLIASP